MAMELRFPCHVCTYLYVSTTVRFRIFSITIVFLEEPILLYVSAAVNRGSSPTRHS